MKTIDARPAKLIGVALPLPEFNDSSAYDKMAGKATVASAASRDTQKAAARAIVMEIERSLGFEPTDREFEKLGHDIESRVPGQGRLSFIKVKGRVTGADVITVTRNEILHSLNKPDDFILAIAEFMGD